MNPLFIFTHVPRTAGTSLRVVAEQSLGKDRIHAIYGEDINDPVTTLMGLNLNKIDLIRGHIAFGLHEHIDRECKYIALVRDPLERVYSLFRYVRTHPGHHLYEATEGMSFQAFVESGVTAEANNGQCRQLAGLDGEFVQEPYAKPEHTPYGGNCHSVLLKAIANISYHYAWVANTRNFDRHLHYFIRKWQWRVVGESRTVVNVSGAGKQARDLPLEVRQTVWHYNQQDYRLVQKYTKGGAQWLP